MKKIIYDDSCKFCTGSVDKIFDDDSYELTGSSKLSKKDQEKLKDYDLSKEIVMIDEDGSIKRNIDVFMDTKKQSKLHKIASFGPIHFLLRQVYKVVSKIRYRLR